MMMRRRLPLTHTALFLLSPEQRAQIVASEGDAGYTDVLTQSRLADIEHPVVLRGDGVQGAIYELAPLLDYFEHHQRLKPDDEDVPHPILRGVRVKLGDIDAVEGAGVAGDNGAHVDAAVAAYRAQHPFTSSIVPLPRQRHPAPDVIGDAVEAFTEYVARTFPRDTLRTMATFAREIESFLMDHADDARVAGLLRRSEGAFFAPAALAMTMTHRIIDDSLAINMDYVRATRRPPPFVHAAFPFYWTAFRTLERDAHTFWGAHTMVLNPGAPMQ
jgi:hypothetical protein